MIAPLFHTCVAAWTGKKQVPGLGGTLTQCCAGSDASLSFSESSHSLANERARVCNNNAICAACVCKSVCETLVVGAACALKKQELAHSSKRYAGVSTVHADQQSTQTSKNAQRRRSILVCAVCHCTRAQVAGGERLCGRNWYTDKTSIRDTGNLTCQAHTAESKTTFLVQV